MAFQDFVNQQQSKKKQEQKTAGQQSGGFEQYVRQKEGLPESTAMANAANINNATNSDRLLEAMRMSQQANAARDARRLAAQRQAQQAAAEKTRLEQIAAENAARQRARDDARAAIRFGGQRQLDAAAAMRAQGGWRDMERLRQDTWGVNPGMLSERARGYVDPTREAREAERLNEQLNAGIRKNYSIKLQEIADSMAAARAKEMSGTLDDALKQYEEKYDTYASGGGRVTKDRYRVVDKPAWGLGWINRVEATGNAETYARETERDAAKAQARDEYFNAVKKNVGDQRQPITALETDEDNERWRKFLDDKGVMLTYGAALDVYDGRVYHGTDNPNPLTSWSDKVNGLMTPEEYNAAVYIWNKKGINAYLDYIDSMWDELMAREREQGNAKVQEWGEAHPYLGTAAALAGSVVNEPLSLATNAARIAKGVARGMENNPNGNNSVGSVISANNDSGLRFNRNDWDMRLADANAILQSQGAATAANLAGGALETAGNWAGGLIGQGDIGTKWGLNEKGAAAGRFLYNAAFSSIQSAINKYTFGEKGTVLMGAGAMTSTMRDVLDNGGSADQALLMGTVSGLVEIWTESQTFENLEKMATEPLENLGRTVLSSAFGEGYEEYIGSWLEQITDQTVMKDKSEFARRVKEYKAQGMTDAEAARAAYHDAAMERIESAALGATSGAMGIVPAQLQRLYINTANRAAMSDIEKLSKQYDAETAKLFVEGYNPDTMTPAQYKGAFDVLYRAGEAGMTDEQVYSRAGDLIDVMGEDAADRIIHKGAENGIRNETAEDATAGLTNTQKQMAEAKARAAARESDMAQEGVTEAEIGEDTQRAARAEDIIEEAGLTESVREAEAGREIADMPKASQDEGESYTRDVQTGVVRAYGDRKLTRQQENQLRALDALGKRYGVEFEIKDTLRGGTANGIYVRGQRRIQVALDATAEAYVQAGAHELVHYLRDGDSEGYNTFEAFVLDTLSRSGSFDLDAAVRDRISSYAARGVELKPEMAREEIVAEAIPQVFATESVIKEFVAGNRTLAQKVADWLREFVAAVRESISRYADIEGRSEIKALEGNVEALEEIASAFDAALGRAQENRARNQETAEEETTQPDEQAAPISGALARARAEMRIISREEVSREPVKAQNRTQEETRETTQTATQTSPIAGEPKRETMAEYADRELREAKESGANLYDEDVGSERKTGVIKRYRRAHVTHDQRVILRGLDAIAKKYNFAINVYEKLNGVDAVYDGHGVIAMSLEAVKNGYTHVAMREMINMLKAENPQGYIDFRNAMLHEVLEADEDEGLDGVSYEIDKVMAAAKEAGQEIDQETALDNVVADNAAVVLTDEDAVARLMDKHATILEKARDFINNFIRTARDMILNRATENEGLTTLVLAGRKDALIRLSETLDHALGTIDGYTAWEKRIIEELDIPQDAKDTFIDNGVRVGEQHEIFWNPQVAYNMKSFRESAYYLEPEKVAQAIAAMPDYTLEQAREYISNLTSAAAIVANNAELLDYVPDMEYSALKDNSEYKYTLDFSTLCPKRLLYTATFDEIQRRIGDGILFEDDVIEIRDIMVKEGLEVACAFCYVESRRKDNGRIINEFLDKYREAAARNGEMELGPSNRRKKFKVEPGFIPGIPDFNTMDGYSNIRKNHRDVYEAYKYFMNARGTSKPKLIEAMTNYRDDIILKKFKNKNTVKAIIKKGGLRIHSFSDLQTVTILDMMQAVTDMSRVRLTGQVYAKMPDMGLIFGGTGLKINQSVIAKGLDENGEIIFDDKEGMNHEEAFRIRDMYPKDVGTVIVGGSDEVILAAFKDDRIDFVLPFHRSGWKHHNLVALGIGDYKDYSPWQTEKELDTGLTTKKPIYPSDYWDFNLSGDENAKRYLALCEKRGLRPKFPMWKEESGYWKTLIDWKMYDNDGVGAPQRVVRPEFNMAEVERALTTYDGSQNNVQPVDSVVQEFFRRHPERLPGQDQAEEGQQRFSLKNDKPQRELKKRWKRAYDLGVEMASRYDSEEQAFRAMDADTLEDMQDFENEAFFTAGFNGFEPEWVEAVRWGDIPEGGRSINHAENRWENGVSAVKIIRDESDWDARSIYDVTLGGQGFKKRRIAGWWLGQSGSDGEPLLIGAEYANNVGKKFSLKGTSAEETDVDATLRKAGAEFDFEDFAEDEAERAKAAKKPDRTAYGQLVRARETVDKTARRYLKEFYSKYDQKLLEENLVKLTEEIALNGATKDTLQAATDLARAIIEKGEVEDPLYTAQNADAIRNIKNTKIKLSPEQAQYIRHLYGTIRNFKRVVGNVFNLSTQDGVPIDKAWQDFEESAPGLADQEIINPQDMIDAMPYVAEALKPRNVTLTQMGMDADAAAVELGLRMQSDALARVSLSQRVREENEALKKENRQLGKENKKLAKQAGDMDALAQEYEELNADNERLTKQVQEYEELQGDIDQAVKQSQEYRGLQADNERLTKQGQKAQEKIDALKRENRQLGRENRKLGKRVEQEDALELENERLQDANKKLAYTADQAAKASESFRKLADQLKAHYQEQMRREKQRIIDRRRQAFDDVAAQLKTADETGDAQAKADAMRRYRQVMRMVGAEQAEAAARVAARHQAEDDRARSLAYGRIRKRAEDLKNTLAKPDRKKHIPLEMQEPVLRVLESMDFRSGGRETVSSKQWRDDLKAIADFLARQLQAQQSGTGDNADNGLWMSLCEETIDRFNTAVDTLTKAGQSSALTEMTAAELTAYSNALAILNHAINSVNETWTNARYATMDALGQATVDEMRKLRDKKIGEKSPLAAIDNLLNVDNLDAGAFMERLGGKDGAAYTVFEELRRGQDKAYERIRQASEATPEMLGTNVKGSALARRVKEIRGWSEEKHTFKIPGIYDGKPGMRDVTLTGTQLMEMYALSKREQARKHLLTGGFQILDPKGDIGERIVQIDEGMLNSMIAELTDDQKRTVDRLQSYLSTVVSEWGNEVTEDMYLFRMFGEENYWPITTAKGFRRTKEQDGTLLFNAVVNMGFAKKVQDMVGNPVVIGDAINTYTKHVSQMATYSGMARPMDDFLRWYNYVERDENGRVNYQGGVVKNEIKRVIGKRGVEYVQRLMDDLNGMGDRAMVPQVLPKRISNYKRAAVAGKLRVAIQQGTAILRASALMNPKYFLRPDFMVGQNTIDEMQEHSPLAWWKGNGNYEIGTGQSVKSVITGMNDTATETIMEKAGALAGKVDDIGWGILWKAVKRETAAEHKELTAGSEEYWDHVRERAEEIYMQTQVVDTVLTRSALMRSKDTLAVSLTAFMSESTRNYNLIRSAIGEYYRALQTGEAGAKKKAIKAMTLGVLGIGLSQALNAVMTGLFDAFKYYDPEDEDEEGNPVSRMDTFLGNWQEDMIDGINPLTNIPFVKDIYAIVTGGEVSRTDLDVFYKLYSAYTRLKNFAEGNSRGYTTWAAIKPTITSIGDFFGLPVSGLVADIELAFNILNPGATRTYEPDRVKNAAVETLYEAIATGDTAKAGEMYQSLKSGKYGRAPMSEKDIQTELSKMLAMNDPRIAEAWEMKQDPEGGDWIKIWREIKAEGFDADVVSKAINDYPTLMKADLKKAMLKAQADGDDELVQQIRGELEGWGVKPEKLDKWLNGEDLEEELTVKATYFELYQMIRAGEGEEEERMRQNLMENGDSNKDISKGLADQLALHDERIEEMYWLREDGQASRVAALKRQVMADGFTDEEVTQAINRFKSLKTAELKEQYLDTVIGGEKASDMPEWVGNVHMTNRPVIDAKELVKAGWDDAGEGIATIYTSTYGAGDRSMDDDYNFDYNQNVVINVTPITANGKVLGPEQLDDYLASLIEKSMKSGQSLMELDKTQNGGKGLLLSVDNVAGSLSAAYDKAGRDMEKLHLQQEAYYEPSEGDQGIKDQLLKLGVKDETIAGWTAGKDMDEELEDVKEYTSAHLYGAIRSGETTKADILDIRDYLISKSEAEDPEESVMKGIRDTFKAEYIEAFYNKPREAERLKKQLMLAGVTEKSIDGWIYSQKGLAELISSGGSESEIAEYAKHCVDLSDAQDPAASVASGVKSALKDEYLALIDKGNTAGAQALKKRMMAAGVSEEAIDKLVTTQQKASGKQTMTDYIDRGDSTRAADEIQRLIDEGVMTKQSVVTTLNGIYKEKYCLLMDAGKDREADALIETMMELGLKKSNGTNYYSPAWWKEQYAKWREGEKD